MYYFALSRAVAAHPLMAPAHESSCGIETYNSRDALVLQHVRQWFKQYSLDRTKFMTDLEFLIKSQYPCQHTSVLDDIIAYICLYDREVLRLVKNKVPYGRHTPPYPAIHNVIGDVMEM